MPRLSEAKILGRNEKILLFGDPGVGKTHISGTMPLPIFFLIVGGDNELKTLKGRIFRDMYGDIEDSVWFENVIEVAGERGKFEGAQAFDTACDLLDEALERDASGEWPFNSLVIENVTTFMEVIMNKSIIFNAGTAQSQILQSGIVKPADRDWGTAQSIMERFVIWIRDIDKHVCLVGHERRVYARPSPNSRDQVLIDVLPEFVGQQRRSIPRAFDNVWRVTMSGQGKGAHTLTQTVRDPVVMAKTRVGGVLRDSIRNLNMTEAIGELAAHEE